MRLSQVFYVCLFTGCDCSCTSSSRARVCVVVCRRWFIGKSIARKVNYSARSGKHTRTRRSGGGKQTRELSPCAEPILKPGRPGLRRSTRFNVQRKVAACLLTSRELSRLRIIMLEKRASVSASYVRQMCPTTSLHIPRF